MIGLKSVAAIALAVGLVAIAAARGALGFTYLESLSGAAWLAIGLVASLVAALLGVGWRFGVPSRGALRLRPLAIVDETETVLTEETATPTMELQAGTRGGAIDLEDGAAAMIALPAPRRAAFEIPGAWQRALVTVALVALALPALGNHAAARIVQLPEDLAEPQRSQYCLGTVPAHWWPPPDLAEARGPKPEAPAQAGCALVRRAVALGYAKSLGSCAPKQAVAKLDKPEEKVEVCTRRHLDEPYLHYAYRRLAEAFGKLGETGPREVFEHRTDDIRAHFDHADDLMADVNHAITGSPHASHHLWINLPDPHPLSLRERFTGIPRCSTRYADLPLWPPPTDPSLLVEHVLGQLLFATPFGTTASCNDYAIHWDAPADACTRLAANPAGFLAETGALASVREVLDRRRRQLAIADLDRAIGRKPPDPPPPVSAIVSLQCLSIGTAAPPAAATITLDGETLAVRRLGVTAIRGNGDGPIDVYLALAALLAGTDLPKPAPAATIDTSKFLLVHADELRELDPFAGARWPLLDPQLVAIFPFELHIHAFVDAFRRRYLPQRGRL